jgi:alkanesulfonate monooxygenase SsuD/methylene tetrahydromethanopterin reductase-like flavin-dependent oxidoreductase (luciferase family)
VVEDALGSAVVGSPETVRRGLEEFVARTGADELMVTANIFDHGKRKRSFEILAEVHGGMKGAASDRRA